MLDTVFLIAAIVGGTVMVCQFLLTFLGIGDEGAGDVGADAEVAVDVSGDIGADAEHPTSWSHAADADVGHPDGSRIFEVLSFRSVVAAIAFFGFTGKASLASGHTDTQALLISLAAGAGAMFGVYWIMLKIYQLRTSGNENIQNALGQPASVYVAIPGQGHGMGKVHLVVQNRTVEYQAITEQQESLKSGAPVVVVDILGPDKVLVESSVDSASFEA